MAELEAPLAGPEGELLRKMALAMGLAEEQFCIAKVVKQSGLKRYESVGGEVLEATRYLNSEIEKASPQIIVTFGSFAAQALLESESELSQMRTQNCEKSLGETRYPVFPTLALDLVLHNPDQKKDVWEDLEKAMSLK